MYQYCLTILINEHQSCIRQEYNEKKCNKKGTTYLFKELFWSLLLSDFLINSSNLIVRNGKK